MYWLLVYWNRLLYVGGVGGSVTWVGLVSHSGLIFVAEKMNVQHCLHVKVAIESSCSDWSRCTKSGWHKALVSTVSNGLLELRLLADFCLCRRWPVFCPPSEKNWICGNYFHPVPVQAETLFHQRQHWMQCSTAFYSSSSFVSHDFSTI